MKETLYEETQKFGHNGIWFVILGLFLATFYAFTQLSLMGVNQILLIAMIPSITLLFYLLMLFRRFQLWVLVTPKSLEFQFFPSQKEIQVIEWDFVKSVELRDYSAFKHFGGWGVRYGEMRSYTMGGNRGVELTFTNGRKLLLGSKKPQDLYQAIRKGMRK
jgi:hypothetical protein